MAQKKTSKQRQEDADLEAYLEAQRVRRTSILKRVGIIILCLALVVAFCIPAISWLIS
ncbi:MAG: hypothetical protein LUD25_02525 [Coriobacteriaceae bacterium]|nr:hypothetical protein [Coriobacteriaceae bacterium]